MKTVEQMKKAKRNTKPEAKPLPNAEPVSKLITFNGQEIPGHKIMIGKGYGLDDVTIVQDDDEENDRGHLISTFKKTLLITTNRGELRHTVYFKFRKDRLSETYFWGYVEFKNWRFTTEAKRHYSMSDQLILELEKEIYDLLQYGLAGNAVDDSDSLLGGY